MAIFANCSCHTPFTTRCQSPCMASCRFQRRPFCCVCKPFFVPGVARSTRRRLQFACAPFSLMPEPEGEGAPPTLLHLMEGTPLLFSPLPSPVSFPLLPLPCSIFIATRGVQRSEASSKSFPSAPFSLILDASTSFPSSPPPSASFVPFSVYLICQKMFTARVLRAAKNALAAIEKCCVRVSQILNAVCQRGQRSRDHHTHTHSNTHSHTHACSLAYIGRRNYGIRFFASQPPPLDCLPRPLFDAPTALWLTKD